MHSFFCLKQLFFAVVLLSGMAHGTKYSETHPIPTLPFNHFANFIPQGDSIYNNDPIVKMDSTDCIIPFSRAGNLIIIKAKVDSIEGNFVLDTGAPGLVLNMTYFRDYAAAGSTGSDGGGITGDVVGYDKTQVTQLSFGHVTYYRTEADRLNLGHIENNKGIKIHGLLGVQLFQRFEMIIDYENSKILLHLISKKEEKKYQHPMLEDTAAYSIFPINILENKIITYGIMGNKKLTFLVDTGAETNVLDSRLAANVTDNVTIIRRITLNGAGSKKVDALYGDMKNLKMGSRDISSMPVILTNMEKMCFSYDRCLDGMLGFDFLSMHKIAFNFVKRKMYIWK
jgi:hypothetical protein